MADMTLQLSPMSTRHVRISQDTVVDARVSLIWDPTGRRGDRRDQFDSDRAGIAFGSASVGV